MAAPIKINTDSLKQRRDWKRHAINAGENIYRVLPPFGEEANGYPYRRWVIAWMNDPETGRRRPYASPRSFGEDACPVTEYAAALEKKRDDIEAALKAKGVDKDTIKEKLKPFGQVLWEIKPKASYVYNAANKAGEVGLLELKKTAHDGMKKTMMQYITDYSQDPTSLNSDQEDAGVWFKIKKEGESTNTEYSVEKNQTKKKTSEGLVFVDDRSELPQNIVDNYESLAYDLGTIYKRHTYEELMLVLQANLAAVYAKYPVARIAGFESASIEVSGEEVEEAPVVKAAAPTAKKAVPTLKLDDVDDEADEAAPVVAAKPATAKATPIKAAPAKSKMGDDVFDYAESILNS
jgi:hypothetical protein